MTYYDILREKEKKHLLRDNNWFEKILGTNNPLKLFKKIKSFEVANFPII